MSKNHFPVNDKTIADVNKANARLYSADAETPKLQPHPKSAGNSLTRHERKILRTAGEDPHPKSTSSLSRNDRKILRMAGDDHVRESSQEKGEKQRDASHGEKNEAIFQHRVATHLKEHPQLPRHEAEYAVARGAQSHIKSLPKK